MLKRLQPLRTRVAAPRRQRGVVLMISLIMLVALTLAGIAIMRSVDTGLVIAGNLAFKHAATNAADRGLDQAIAWLGKNNGINLFNNQANGSGYFPIRIDPGPTETWDHYWQTQGSQVVSLGPDKAGNAVSYVIHRMCNASGDPLTSNCLWVTVKAQSNASSNQAGNVPLAHADQVYYRITTRVDGPRSTVSYVQTFVSM